MNLETISWQKNKIKIIDQSKLPFKLEYLYIRDIVTLYRAIRRMCIRGAPALGAAAGLGVYLGIKDFRGNNLEDFKRKVKEISHYISSSRPTARNLFWGIERVNSVILKNRSKDISNLKELIFWEALSIIKEDKKSCDRIGRYGSVFIQNNDGVLTICNAGLLATCGLGTALNVLYQAKKEGKNFKVYASETRPLLQGSRLTAWELKKNRMDFNIICDNTAGFLMQQEKVNCVIAGADRIAGNGDTANKIGTYNLAVLSRHHKIPFYIAAPFSTVDLSIKGGDGILIEERNPDEITTLLFKRKIAPNGLKVTNPAFDVTEHKLITAIITDRGIIRPPFNKNLMKISC